MKTVAACCSVLLIATLTGMIADVQAQLNVNVTINVNGTGIDSSLCHYTSCQHNGICKSYNGTEICNCENTGYTGMFCELPIGECEFSMCGQGGSCVNTPGGGKFCLCYPGFVGEHCEYNDTTYVCPTVEEGDMKFLPRCTLKQSLGIFANCINYQLLDLNIFDIDIKVCSKRVWQTVQCIYSHIGYCSNSWCDSGFTEGGEIIYENIAKELYNPESPFMMQVYELLCTPPIPGVGFPSLGKILSIGKPVCTEDVIDRMIGELIATGNQVIMPGADTCRELDKLRTNMYNIAESSCDWDKIGDVLLNFNISAESSSYWAEVLRIAHSEFLNWRVPGCENSTNGDMCTSISCGVGHCYSYNGTEWCDCSNTGYTGIYCETPPVTECPPNTCQNGHCTVLISGDHYCTCYERWSGEYCEIYNESAVCAVVADNDVEFFPMCTLRQTVGQTMQCLSGLTHHLFGQSDEYQCSMAYHETVECLGNMVASCSKLVCERSIYILPNADETIQYIFMMLSDPMVSAGVTGAVCRPDGGQMILEYIRNIFRDLNMNNTMDDAINILCPGYSIRNVTMGLQYLVEMIGGSSDLRETCRLLDEAGDHVYNTLTHQCNLQYLESLGRISGYGEVIRYVAKGVNVMLSMVRNFTLPICQGRGGTDGPFCPRITHSSCQSEVADAYMCSYFVYSKMVSQWIEQIMQMLRNRAGSMDRDWNEYATMMGFRQGYSYGMAWGEYGFVEMMRANLECGSTSSMHCNGGYEFWDVMGCLHCYSPGASAADGRSMLMEWGRVYQQGLFLQKFYQSISKEMLGGCGGSVDPTMPPFTDFTTWFSTSTSYTSGGSTRSSTNSPPGTGSPPTTTAGKVDPGTGAPPATTVRHIGPGTGAPPITTAGQLGPGTGAPPATTVRQVGPGTEPIPT